MAKQGQSGGKAGRQGSGKAGQTGNDTLKMKEASVNHSPAKGSVPSGHEFRSDRSARYLGDTLIGSRMPSLTYMLTFADVADLTKKWALFVPDPAWKDLARQPGNTDAEIVGNISNLYLSSLPCSQI